MKRLPGWFKQEFSAQGALAVSRQLNELNINTVCRQALCPNVNTCFKNNQLTFLILGKRCTRSCSFCNVEKGGIGVLSVDMDEPQRIARAAKIFGLKYAVITSVTRDDLQDAGAKQFADVIRAIYLIDPEIKVETLIPDFSGNTSNIETVVEAKPYMIAHNLETVERLYGDIRPQADYTRSLSVLRAVKDIDPLMMTKSSLMLGMGEREEEVIAAMGDLRRCDCDFLTLGQYLAPSARHYPVHEFIHPARFKEYRQMALALGFRNVFSDPLVRSSFMAEQLACELTNNLEPRTQNLICTTLSS